MFKFFIRLSCFVLLTFVCACGAESDWGKFEKTVTDLKKELQKSSPDEQVIKTLEEELERLGSIPEVGNRLAKQFGMFLERRRQMLAIIMNSEVSEDKKDLHGALFMAAIIGESEDGDNPAYDEFRTFCCGEPFLPKKNNQNDSREPKLDAEKLKKNAEDTAEMVSTVAAETAQLVSEVVSEVSYVVSDSVFSESKKEDSQVVPTEPASARKNENAKKYLEELNGDETGGGSEASSPSASTTEDDSLLTISLGENVSMTFVVISEGKFTMGSPKSEDGRYTDENQVSVELSSFGIGQTEVTQAQWKSVMGNNPSRFKGDSLPVECVSWDEAMEFCRKLTERERKKGLSEDYKFTLPTEAQWEYACRAGTTTRFSFGNSDRNLYLYGNFYDRSGDTKYDAAFREKNGWKIPPDTSQDDGFVETAPVGSFRPNAWGLYDMHGNVWEWCLDYYNPSLVGGENPYRTIPGSGDYGSCRVGRGGSWNSSAQDCRSAIRGCRSPVIRNNFLGFRVALVQE